MTTNDPERPPSWARRLIWLIEVAVLVALAWWSWQAYRAHRDAASAAATQQAASAPAADAGPSGFGGPGGGPGMAPGGRGGRNGPPLVTAVVAQPAISGSMPVRVGALGTATALNTVTVRAQVAGRLDKLYFTEGQTVKAGQVLAQIDPRSFQVQLDSAQAQLAKDQAQFVAAEVDLKRYQTLLAQDSIASQQVDTQAALVAQYKATVDADRASVASAKLQLSYARVTAPVSGRVGLKQVDIGNLVQTTDTNGIVVITEVQPINVVFPIPQQQLPTVLARLRGGASLPVEAWDGDNHTMLASGKLATIDNQIDTTTGTVKLKAEFPNADNALFPNQFVNVRLTTDTIENAILVPAAAVQQGSRGPYVFVVKDDDTVVMRTLHTGPGDANNTSVTQGLSVGERVVIDGVDRLRDGMKVQVMTAHDQPVAKPNAHRGQRHGGGASAPEGAHHASAPSP